MAWIVTLIAALLISVTAQQDEAPYTAYLFDAETQMLMQVGLDGSTQMISLGLDPEAFIGGYDMAFSADGALLAYCLQDYSGEYNPEGAPTTLVVRDLAAESDVLRRDLNRSFGCRVTAFSPDASRVAVGIVNGFPGEIAGDRALWELRLIDVASGEAVQTLDGDRATVSGNMPPVTISLMPEVIDYTGDAIVFEPVPWASVGATFRSEVFRWDLTTDALTLASVLNGPGVDQLATTGETIWLQMDPNLPLGDPGGPVPAFNTLQYSAADAPRETLYATGEWVLLDALFIDGGREIAMLELEALPPGADPLTLQRTRWLRLDRAGVLTEIGTFDAYSTVVPAPDGFLLLEATYEGANFNPPVTTTLTYHSDDTVETLWTTTADTPGITWDLVWHAPVSPADDLEPFDAAG